MLLQVLNLPLRPSQSTMVDNLPQCQLTCMLLQVLNLPLKLSLSTVVDSLPQSCLILFYANQCALNKSTYMYFVLNYSIVHVLTIILQTLARQQTVIVCCLYIRISRFRFLVVEIWQIYYLINNWTEFNLEMTLALVTKMIFCKYG